MNIKLRIDKTDLNVTCEDSLVIINEIYETDTEIILEVVKPESEMLNIYQQLILNSGEA
jgi:hypothetical protein